jgi:hypothetical protein
VVDNGLPLQAELDLSRLGLDRVLQELARPLELTALGEESVCEFLGPLDLDLLHEAIS